MYTVCEGSELVLFVEEQVRNGCLGEYIISQLALAGKSLQKCEIIAVTDQFPTHAKLDVLHKFYGMDANGIVNAITNALK